MRILITESGEKIIEDLEDLKDQNIHNRTTSYGKSFNKKLTFPKFKNIFEKLRITNQTKTINSTQVYKISPSTTGKQSKTSLQFYRPNQGFTPENTINNIQKFKTTSKRIHLPKDIWDKFESGNETGRSIIERDQESPELTLIKAKHNPKTKYTLGEVLGKKAVSKLKINWIKEKKMRDKLSVVNHNNFRSEYNWWSSWEKLENILNYKKVQPKQVNLITYLNKKSNAITRVSLNKIVKFDCDEMRDANKTCQSLLYFEEENNKLSHIIETKLKSRRIQEKLGFDKNWKWLKREVDQEKTILGKYANRPTNKDYYMEKLYDVEKDFWKHYNCDRFNTKRSLMNNIRRNTEGNTGNVRNNIPRGSGI